MPIEINRRVLEQFVKDKEFMYKLVNNWLVETRDHWKWYGVSLHTENKHFTLRPRGTTQIGIKYQDYGAHYMSDLRQIEKRIVMYKGKR